jgi:hypothetical protein
MKKIIGLGLCIIVQISSILFISWHNQGIYTYVVYQNLYFIVLMPFIFIFMSLIIRKKISLMNILMIYYAVFLGNIFYGVMFSLIKGHELTFGIFIAYFTFNSILLIIVLFVTRQLKVFAVTMMQVYNLDILVVGILIVISLFIPQTLEVHIIDYIATTYITIILLIFILIVVSKQNVHKVLDLVMMVVPALVVVSTTCYLGTTFTLLKNLYSYLADVHRSMMFFSIVTCIIYAICLVVTNKVSRKQIITKSSLLLKGSFFIFTLIYLGAIIFVSDIIYFY